MMDGLSSFNFPRENHSNQPQPRHESEQRQGKSGMKENPKQNHSGGNASKNNFHARNISHTPRQVKSIVKRIYFQKIFDTLPRRAILRHEIGTDQISIHARPQTPLA